MTNNNEWSNHYPLKTPKTISLSFYLKYIIKRFPYNSLLFFLVVSLLKYTSWARFFFLTFLLNFFTICIAASSYSSSSTYCYEEQTKTLKAVTNILCPRLVIYSAPWGCYSPTKLPKKAKKRKQRLRGEGFNESTSCTRIMVRKITVHVWSWIKEVDIRNVNAMRCLGIYLYLQDWKIHDL